jgi:hypothetical protein
MFQEKRFFYIPLAYTRATKYGMKKPAWEMVKSNKKGCKSNAYRPLCKDFTDVRS